MITTQLTKLTASSGMVLTDGKQFTHSVLLREGESPEDWQEVTEEYYRKATAQMTPREFILALMQNGVTREQIEDLINGNDQVWAELNYATTICRINPLLDKLCSTFDMTSEDVDKIFGIGGQDDNI